MPKTDEASVHELAAAFGIEPVTIHMWRARYEDFPQPVRDLGGRRTYSRRAVDRWRRKRWPERFEDE